MSEQPDVSSLAERLRQITARHSQLAMEINELRAQLQQLPQATPPQPVEVPPRPAAEPMLPAEAPAPAIPKGDAAPRTNAASTWEDFVGTNLLNKIGIGILVIGIGFGVKYAIDHDLLQPLTRIILGYGAGGALVAMALRLRKKYAAFSAVLLSGGMAALYFVTYAAYGFYEIIPQLVAFALMVMFTAFTVLASLRYNLQAVAVIGLVGAYAVPFLLSDGSGRVIVLFSYVAIINTGILLVSFLRDWRALFVFAFWLTWLIYGTWMAFDFSRERHFSIGLSFATVFFLVFYIAFIARKVIEQKPLTWGNIASVLLNCFFFYSAGYVLIQGQPQGEDYLGLFTLAHAVLHFSVGVLLYYRVPKATGTFYLVAGLVLVFVTLAIPVQLDGRWVTLLWALEGALLLWIGRSRRYVPYEYMAYPLFALAGLSLLQDWQQVIFRYSQHFLEEQVEERLLPFLNINLLTNLLVAGSLFFSTYVLRRHAPPDHSSFLREAQLPFRFLFPIAGLLVLYIGLFQEVVHFFGQQWVDSAIGDPSNPDYRRYNEDWSHFETLWLFLYTAMFVVAGWWVNKVWIKSTEAEKVLPFLSALALLVFLGAGLDALESLRESYLAPATDDFVHGFWNIGMRYVCYASAAALLALSYRCTQRALPAMIPAERIFSHVVILTLLSSELLSLLELGGISGGAKLALSILWGGYALYLVIWGFVKETAYLRITGIVIFGCTLIKLFLYDLSGMGTIARTIVFLALGALLLIASFIYNQRKKQ